MQLCAFADRDGRLCFLSLRIFTKLCETFMNLFEFLIRFSSLQQIENQLVQTYFLMFCSLAQLLMLFGIKSQTECLQNVRTRERPLWEELEHPPLK